MSWIILGGEAEKTVARCPACQGTDFLTNLNRDGCSYCGVRREKEGLGLDPPLAGTGERPGAEERTRPSPSLSRLKPGDSFDLRLDDEPPHPSRERWTVDIAPADAIGLCTGCGQGVAGEPVAYPLDPENEQQWHLHCFLEDLNPYVIELLKPEWEVGSGGA